MAVFVKEGDWVKTGFHEPDLALHLPSQVTAVLDDTEDSSCKLIRYIGTDGCEYCIIVDEDGFCAESGTTLMVAPTPFDTWRLITLEP